MYSVIVNCSSYFSGGERDTAIQALRPIVSLVESLDEGQRGEEKIKEVILNAVAAMPLEQRESVSEAFHFLFSERLTEPADRELAHREAHYSDPLGTQLSREMGLICDGIPDQWIKEFHTHARLKLLPYLESFMKTPNTSDSVETYLWMSILRCVHETRENLDIASDEMFIDAFPFLVRNLANHFATDTELVSTIDDVYEIDSKKFFEKIAGDFYPRAKQTLKKWEDLNVKTPIGNVAPEAKDLLIIDSKDLAAIHLYGEGLNESQLKLFAYDIGSGAFSGSGYANGVIRGWEHAMSLAKSDDDLRGEDIADLYRIILEADYKEFSFRDQGGRLGTGYLFDSSLTEDVMQEIRDFINEVRSIHPDAPKMQFYKKENNEYVYLDDCSYAEKEGLGIFSGAATLEGIKAAISHLATTFNDELKSATTLEEVRQASLRISRKLVWLHPSYDANGRVGAHLVRNICLIKGQRKINQLMGIQAAPIVSTPLDPGLVEGLPIEKGSAILERDEQLSIGTLKLVDVWLAHSPLLDGRDRAAYTQHEKVTAAGLGMLLERVNADDIPNEKHRNLALLGIAENENVTKEQLLAVAKHEDTVFDTLKLVGGKLGAIPGADVSQALETLREQMLASEDSDAEALDAIRNNDPTTYAVIKRIYPATEEGRVNDITGGGGIPQGAVGFDKGGADRRGSNERRLILWSKEDEVVLLTILTRRQAKSVGLDQVYEREIANNRGGREASDRPEEWLVPRVSTRPARAVQPDSPAMDNWRDSAKKRFLSAVESTKKTRR